MIGHRYDTGLAALLDQLFHGLDIHSQNCGHRTGIAGSFPVHQFTAPVHKAKGILVGNRTGSKQCSVFPQAVAGEDGTKVLAALIRTWCDLKLWHIQFNIVNTATLKAAQKDPEKYRNLLVRVAGYSAYFVDLSPDLQDEIIRRTEHGMPD